MGLSMEVFLFVLEGVDVGFEGLVFSLQLYYVLLQGQQQLSMTTHLIL